MERSAGPRSYPRLTEQHLLAAAMTRVRSSEPPSFGRTTWSDASFEPGMRSPCRALGVKAFQPVLLCCRIPRRDGAGQSRPSELKSAPGVEPELGLGARDSPRGSSGLEPISLADEPALCPTTAPECANDRGGDAHRTRRETAGATAYCGYADVAASAARGAVPVVGGPSDAWGRPGNCYGQLLSPSMLYGE